MEDEHRKNTKAQLAFALARGISPPRVGSEQWCYQEVTPTLPSPMKVEGVDDGLQVVKTAEAERPRRGFSAWFKTGTGSVAGFLFMQKSFSFR